VYPDQVDLRLPIEKQVLAAIALYGRFLVPKVTISHYDGHGLRR
jgi:hypothetical protein